MQVPHRRTRRLVGLIQMFLICLLFVKNVLTVSINFVIYPHKSSDFFFTIQCNCFVQRLDDVYLVNNQIYNDFLISFLFLSFRNTMLCFIQELNKNKIKITRFSLCVAYFEIQLFRLFCYTQRHLYSSFICMVNSVFFLWMTSLANELGFKKFKKWKGTCLYRIFFDR